MSKLIPFKRKGGTSMDYITIFDVAISFLTMGSMTHKKLQKLCYYAQAWYLALYKERLLNIYFEAWVHGPVCPDLYHQYKENGWINISQEDRVPDIIVNKGKYDFLKTIYDTYGGFTGDELEVLTHSELPWKEARKGLEEWEPSHNNICEKTMQDFYWKVYEQSQND